VNKGQEKSKKKAETIWGRKYGGKEWAKRREKEWERGMEWEGKGKAKKGKNCSRVQTTEHTHCVCSVV